jgi:rhodanese-related sulfurtransferase
MAPVTPTFPGNRVTPAQLQAWVQAGEPVLVLDVRDRQRWAAEAARLPGAMWVPIEELPHRARDFRSGLRLVVYCS